MINHYSNFLENMFSTLLDVYQMAEWDMSWYDFIEQAKKEAIAEMDKWKNEPVDVDEDDEEED